MRKRFFKKPQPRNPLFNRQIRAPRVRVVDEDARQVGVMILQRALEMAQERGLDLIQVTEKVEPPVCKIGDYGKFLYQKQKKERTARKKSAGELKGIRLSFGISLHDLETRVGQAEKFLKKGSKVKVEMRLKGRQKALKEFAREKIDKFLEILGGRLSYRVERELKRGPGGLTMIISKQ